MNTKNKNTIIASLHNVSKFYNVSVSQEAALKNVTVEAYRGEMILLLGPSGSGKTTLLTLMAGMQSPSVGEVKLFGTSVSDYSPKQLQLLRAKKLGFIFQSFYLIDSLTVLENVMLVLKFAGITGRIAKQKAFDYLRRFEVHHLSNKYPLVLSQGEKQRVAVARALVNGATFIIADEPTGSLATKQGMMIVDFLKAGVDNEDLCVVIASHDERIAQKADRVLNLNDGELF